MDALFVLPVNFPCWFLCLHDALPCVQYIQIVHAVKNAIDVTG